MGYRINERADKLIWISEEKYRDQLEQKLPIKSGNTDKYNFCKNQNKKANGYLDLTIIQCTKCKKFDLINI